MKAIRSLIPDVGEEKIFSFTRGDDGFFRKTEKTVYRNRYTNEIKHGKEIILEGLYRATLDDEYDDELKYQDIDGSSQTLKLKLVKEENMEQFDSDEGG